MPIYRPNILIIYTDQQRFDAIGVNGNDHIITPNLDKLAADGTNFTNCFVQNPLCMPSRASFMSGRYPSSIGITHMGVPMPEDIPVLPQYLSNFGYVTGNIGKLHFLPHANRDHRDIHPDYGFDHLEISDDPGAYEDAYRAWVRAHYPDQLDFISPGMPSAGKTWRKTLGIEDRTVHCDQRYSKQTYTFQGRDEVTHSAFVADRTMDFIDVHKDEPWMCVAGFYSPHSPWVAPQKFLDMYDPKSLPLPDFPPEIDKQRSADFCSDYELRDAKHGYYAMVTEVDHYVGKILDKLEKQGQADNTLVVFTSDHGDWLGDHLKYNKGYPGDDLVTNVPLIIKSPKGAAGAGKTFDGLVEAVDILPTLLECAGIPVSGDLQGKSLAPALEGQDFSGKDSALTEFAGWKTLRSARYRYLCEANGKEELYDLENDPLGYNDVSNVPKYAQVLAQMRHKMILRVLNDEQPRRKTWEY